MGGITCAVAAYVVEQLSVRRRLTSTLFWVLTSSSVATVLSWFVYYPVYRKDTAKMQQILTERLVELTADT